MSLQFYLRPYIRCGTSSSCTVSFTLFFLMPHGYSALKAASFSIFLCFRTTKNFGDTIWCRLCMLSLLLSFSLWVVETQIAKREHASKPDVCVGPKESPKTLAGAMELTETDKGELLCRDTIKLTEAKMQSGRPVNLCLSTPAGRCSWPQRTKSKERRAKSEL